MKRPALTLLLLLIAAPIFAAELRKIEIDSSGNLYHFWIENKELKFSKSIDQGKVFSPPKRLLFFTQEATSLEIKAEKDNFFIAYTSGESLYLTFSKNISQPFSPPRLMAKKAKNPALAIYDNLLALAWENKNAIHFTLSEDRGLSFEEPKSLQVTGEALSSPALLIDNFKNLQLVFLSSSPLYDLNKIFHVRLPAAEPKILFESHDDLKKVRLQSLPLALLVSWQEEYLKRRASFIALSLDNGKNFSGEKELDLEKDPAGFYFLNEQLYAVIVEEQTALEEVEFPLLPAPQVYRPQNNSILNSSNLKVTYRVQGNNPLLCKINLSQQESFPSASTWSFEQLISPISQNEIEFSLPVLLSEGTYFLHIYCQDGITSSSPSQTIQFKIDHTPPRITSLEAERVKESLLLRGETDEFPAWLTINGRGVSFESERRFKSLFPLSPGQNLFTLMLSDEAGNLSLATQEVFYDPACPQITVLKPQASDWFRSGSAVIIEAEISDLQNDIEDEASARIMIDHQILEQTISYDSEENKVSGFVSLPPGLSDGSHSASIILSDKLGNEGRANFTLRIDSSPPQIFPEPCFTNSQTSFVVPVIEAGAGFDASGSLIKIAGVSFEGRVSTEGEEIILRLDFPLLEGSYEVSVVPRDLIGNLGKATSFCLRVDQTLPRLTLVGSYESITAQEEIIIQGQVAEEYPSTLAIYNNQKKIEDFALNGLYFSKSIKLVPGNNEILIEAKDQASNKSSQSIHVFAEIKASTALLSSIANGPNPFSPSRDGQMHFLHTLSTTANLKIFIFDLAGNLIWKKEMQNTAAPNTSWNGSDHYGTPVSNGVYPYIICASAGSTQEIRRGKIIILK